MSELERCPFCNAHAVGPDRCETPGGRPKWQITCAVFCVRMIRDTKAEVEKSWNTRAQPAPIAPQAVAGDLAALVKQLVQALRKAAPNHDLSARALDYLKRNNLQGSPLRATTVDGIEQAARYIEKRRDNYVEMHGSYDPDTGATELPGDGDEYVGELEEIAEDIRALAAPIANTPTSPAKRTKELMESAKSVMMSAHALCPTDMSHPNRMSWIANYFLDNYSAANTPAVPDKVYCVSNKVASMFFADKANAIAAVASSSPALGLQISEIPLLDAATPSGEVN